MQQTKFINLKNPFTISIIAFIVLCIIIISISIFSLSDKYGQLQIDNFSNLIDLPEEGKKEIFNLLYSYTKNELGNDIPTSGAIIREDSITSSFDKKHNVYSGSFIVDIDSIKKTYVISYQWSPDDGSVASGTTITCPTKSIDRYETGINCINALKETDQIRLLKILPSYIDINDKLTAYASVKYYGNNINDPYLEINVNTCNNSSLISQTKAKIEEWLDDHYIGKDAVPFEIRNLCDGAF